MRIVHEGTAGHLYRLTRRHLPRDLDLRNSYLRYVDLSGLDLSAYDMRDMDIIDCVARGVILPDFGVDGMQATDYLVSRRTDWTDANLPVLFSSYNHDLVVEAVRQNIPSLTGKHLDAARIIESYIGGDYGRSWRDGYWQIMDQMKLDRDGVLEAVLPMFKGYPRLEARLRDHHRRDDITPNPPNLRRDLSKVDIAVSRERVTLDIRWWLQDTTKSRYEVALDIQRSMRSLHGEHLEVWIPQLDPYPVVFVRDYDISSDLTDWRIHRWGLT